MAVILNRLLANFSKPAIIISGMKFSQGMLPEPLIFKLMTSVILRSQRVTGFFCGILRRTEELC